MTDTRISVRVPDDLDAAFAAAAAVNGATRSEAARAAIEAYIEAAASFHGRERPASRPADAKTPAVVGPDDERR